MNSTANPSEPSPDIQQVDEVITRARKAQENYEKHASQENYDLAALAAAWALMESQRNRFLSELAVESTGLGNVADKQIKNHRKILGTLRDIKGKVTTGVISDNKQTGITEIARPIGVVGAVVPSTNPAATPTNNVVNALKCGNAIVLSPSPAGAPVCAKLLEFMHAEFDKIGIDKDLVQMVPAPSSKVKTQRLMETADLIIVTGSQDNVRRAYSSGTPAIGVGAGNATVIVDETADVVDAAAKIAQSKTFDNATSCSSENVVIVVSEIKQAFSDALANVGGRILSDNDANAVKSALFRNGKLNRHMIAKDIEPFLAEADISVQSPETARFVVLETEGVGPDYPESGEKLSLALTLYTANDFNDATDIARRVLSYQGAGHSIGLHSADDSRAMQLGLSMPTCRVIVNQAHAIATGGAFDNGLPFSLSMGCGSWGRNSIDSNLNYTHYMNTTRVVRPIASDEPELDDIFNEYWQSAGK